MYIINNFRKTQIKLLASGNKIFLVKIIDIESNIIFTVKKYEAMYFIIRIEKNLIAYTHIYTHDNYSSV